MAQFLRLALGGALVAAVATGAAPAASARLVLVDRARARAATVLTASAYGVVWAPGGGSLLVDDRSSYPGRLLEVPRAGGPSRVVRRLPPLSTLGPGGRSVQAESEPPRAFVVRDAGGGVTVRVHERPVLPDAVAWSADGRRLAVLVEKPDDVTTTLIVLDTDFGRTILRRRVPEGISMAPQAFAPDAAALVLGMDDRVVRLDVTTGASRTLRRLPREEGGASAVWSSATGRIAVQSQSRLFTIDSGPRPSPVMPIEGRPSSALAWTPDGRALSFFSGGELPGLPMAHAWSPDGRTLALGYP